MTMWQYASIAQERRDCLFVNKAERSIHTRKQRCYTSHQGKFGRNRQKKEMTKQGWTRGRQIKYTCYADLAHFASLNNYVYHYYIYHCSTKGRLALQKIKEWKKISNELRLQGPRQICS